MWFRNEKHIVVIPFVHKGGFAVNELNSDGKPLINGHWFATFEEACEKAMDICIGYLFDIKNKELVRK
jgi:hypothetical protein